MRLSDKAMMPTDSKIVFLDTSAILSNSNYLRRNSTYIVTTGVMQELQGLSYAEEPVGGIAQCEYERLRELLAAGDKGVYLFRSRVRESTENSVLSNVDRNIIDCAKCFKDAMILSADTALCRMAESFGIPTCKIRTRDTNIVVA